MKKELPKELPEYYIKKIKDKFYDCEISYEPSYCMVNINVSSDRYLTFDNFKFLAKLFKTNKVDTGLYAGNGGCPTCDGEIVIDITFTVLDIFLEGFPEGEKENE